MFEPIDSTAAAFVTARKVARTDEQLVSHLPPPSEGRPDFDSTGIVRLTDYYAILLQVQRSSFGRALDCCKAGPSLRLGSAPQEGSAH
jgi:hypothetical protein